MTLMLMVCGALSIALAGWFRRKRRVPPPKNSKSPVAIARAEDGRVQRITGRIRPTQVCHSVAVEREIVVWRYGQESEFLVEDDTGTARVRLSARAWVRPPSPPRSPPPDDGWIPHGLWVPDVHDDTLILEGEPPHGRPQRLLLKARTYVEVIGMCRRSAPDTSRAVAGSLGALQPTEVLIESTGDVPVLVQALDTLYGGL
jgi:hypothetical protein